MKLDAKQLRVTKPSEEQLTKIKRKPLWIILDNVLDTYNIGAIFRLADAVAAQEVILCGGSEAPPSSRIHKSAVGTEEWVPWRYCDSAKEALERLKNQDPRFKIIAVEQDKRAILLPDLFSQTSPLAPLLISGEGNKRGEVAMAVVVGHETEGVSKEVLDMADVIVEIPMWGVNKSLNVIVSLGIVLYKILESGEG
jgi:23S rRNA (guanosine2251-2'-O)-methyltransferase